MNKIKNGAFVVIGYLLSPLCWWNDLFLNLPLAYLFGRICSWVSSDLFLPGAIIMYWVSNIAGILLIQFGTVELFQKQTKERNWKKELFTSLISSTAYTIVILVLLQFNILKSPILLSFLN